MDPEETPPDDLKTRINDLLWTSLPGSATLAEAEDLANVIYADITLVWKRKKEGV